MIVNLHDNFTFEIELANSALNIKNYLKAIEYFKAVIKKKPNQSDALLGIAQSLSGLGNQEDAQKFYKKAEKYNPSEPAIKLAYGTHYLDIGLYKNAIEKYQAALALIKENPTHPNKYTIEKLTLFNLALANRLINNTDTAINLYESYINIYGPSEHALLNLGIALDASGELGRALDIYSRLKSNFPNFNEVNLNIAGTLSGMGRLREAEEIFRKLLAKNPSNNDAAFGLGLLLLKTKRYEEGWRYYVKRWKAKKFFDEQEEITRKYVSKFSELPTEKTPVDQKILVFGEQGVGDIIMFSSYLSILEQYNKITLVCDKKLKKFIKSSFPNIKCTTFSDFPPHEEDKFDLIVPIGDLPLISGFKSEPYLTPSHEAINKFKEIFKDENRFLLGVSWRGGVVTTRMRQRTISLNEMHDIFADKRYKIINIQHGVYRSELEEYAAKHHLDILTLPHKAIEDLDDLAALIYCLDAVITVQNTNVHISGSIGKNCLAMIPNIPEWRYGSEGQSLPWYKTVKLIRQKKANEWAGVMRQIKEQLDEMLKR